MAFRPHPFDPRSRPERGTYALDPDHPLARGLVGAWLFDEGAGRIAENVAQPVLPATVNGGSSLCPLGMSLNGTTGYASSNSHLQLRGLTTLSMAYDGSLTGVARVRLYERGVQQTLTAGAGNPPASISATAGPFEIGRENVLGGRYSSGRFEAAWVHQRALSSDEAAWLHAEPYGMFRRVVRRSYSIATGLLTRRRRLLA